MFEFFDRVYCIHLPNAGRLAGMERQFNNLGIADVTYVHAKPPVQGFSISNMRRAPRAEFGASLSHIKAVVHAIADGAERPLFLEDDVVFRADADEILCRAVKELPGNWDVLYMGGHPREPVRWAGEGLVRVGKWSFAESYAIRRDALLRFYDHWCDRIGQIHSMYDFVLGEFAAMNNGFCVYPHITDQPPGFSQIGDKFDDKRPLVTKGWAANLSSTK